MMLVRQGRVPYVRTGLLGRSITGEVRELAGGQVAGIVGTDDVKAPWVISSESVGSRGPQAEYHQGRWWRLQDEIKSHYDEVVDFYRAMVRRLRGGWR